MPLRALSLKARFGLATSLLILVIVSVVAFNATRPALTPTSDDLTGLKTEVPQEPVAFYSTSTIGRSVEGRPLLAHTFGTGSTSLLFVGGVHGGYEWNTVWLAEQVIAELAQNPELIGENLSVTIIPVLNPDGLALVTSTGQSDSIKPAIVTGWRADGRGRFNANQVDLNRNFDCKWSPQATWRAQSISAGPRPFSEPEAEALRDFVLSNQPVAAVFWHSVANAVYGSECHDGVLPATLEILNLYGRAANYQVIPAFDAYPVTGDVEGWLASLGIPAITVELETRDSAEWDRNWAGVKALLNHYHRLGTD